MAELSDYEVATGLTFLSAKSLTTTFNSGGRNAKRRAYIQLSGLGGLHANQSAISIRLMLNGTSIGQYSVRRYTGQPSVLFDQVLVEFSSDLLKSSGDNTLLIEPLYSNSQDYCWVGPAVVHYKQNS